MYPTRRVSYTAKNLRTYPRCGILARMKSVIYVAPIHCTNTKGEPWPSAKDQKVLTQKEFLLDQIGQDGFAGSRKGVHQVRFQLAVIGAVESAKDGVGYELEDEHHAALVDSIEKAEFSGVVAHNLLPFIDAILDAR
jgi:hypothetical protein